MSETHRVARGYAWRYPAKVTLDDLVKSVIGHARPKDRLTVADLAWRLRVAQAREDVATIGGLIVRAKAEGRLCPIGLDILRREFGDAQRRLKGRVDDHIATTASMPASQSQPRPLDQEAPGREGGEGEGETRRVPR